MMNRLPAENNPMDADSFEQYAQEAQERGEDELVEFFRVLAEVYELPPDNPAVATSSNPNIPLSERLQVWKEVIKGE